MSDASTILPLLRHAGATTTPFALDLPSPYGALRLDLADAAFVLAHPNGLSADEEQAANEAFVAARESYDPAAPEISEAGMRDIVRRWPLWGGGHGALHDLYTSQGRFEDAAYHLRQLIALQPTYENLLSLGELFGRLGRYDDARTLQEHLWATRDAATPGLVETDPQALAYRAASHLLVTLTRQKAGDRMVEVADEALAAFGEDSTLRYQRILGLMLDNRRDEAQEACRAALATVDAEDPLAARFGQMAAMLGV
jgi:tetratricopeptide (TPR) repeat protein